MRLVFFSPILNIHQAAVADALWRLTGGDYRFVETENLTGEHRKGGVEDFTTRPYYVAGWQDAAQGMRLAVEADCCVFSGAAALPYLKARMKAGKLSFDMSERWMKKGWVNMLSPMLLRQWLAYRLGGWGRKPLYKLCCGAYVAADHRKVGMYAGKCYKWGYFPAVPELDGVDANAASLMWCGRYLQWKHPETVLHLAIRLKEKGYRFHIDMYGGGDLEDWLRRCVESNGLSGVVTVHGSVPNHEVLRQMRDHSIFLLTSDRNEGWGAVVNESMSCGCAVVARRQAGCARYMIENGRTGITFSTLEEMCQGVMRLLDSPDELTAIRRAAAQQMREVWNPDVAAQRLLALVECIENDKENPYKSGPCSQA